MSEVNEYPLGGDLTDERISGLLHTTLERLARRTSQQNYQIYQLYGAGEDVGLNGRVYTPTGTDWRDPGQGVVNRRKITDISFDNFRSHWEIYSPGNPSSTTATNNKYVSPRLKETPGKMPTTGAPTPFNPQPMHQPGNPTPIGGNGQKKPKNKPKKVGKGTPSLYQGFVIRISTGDRQGELDSQNNAERFRGSVVLAATSVDATSYFQGQIRGRLPGPSYKQLDFGPNGISLDMRVKAVWNTPGEGAGKKIFKETKLYLPSGADFNGLVSTVITYETENVGSSWSPWDAITALGTAKSQQYDPQQHPGLEIGPNWRGGDLFILDVKVYTDGDSGHTLSEFEVALGELTLDVTYA